MNPSNSHVNDYLFSSPQNQDNIQDFMKIAAALIKDKKIVLLLTRIHVDFMPVLAGLGKNQLKNLIISYHSGLNGVAEKLLELHDWTILPDLVIVNLNSYFGVLDAVPPFKTVCLCISTLLSYMRCVRVQKEAKQTAVARSVSVSLLNAHEDVQIQLLVDFYFYKKAAFHELETIKNEILKYFGV